MTILDNLFFKKKRWDTREHKRVRLAYLVKYQWPADSKTPRIANVRDISAGGVRFITEGLVPESAFIDLTIFVPPLGRTVEARAQVLRVRKAKTGHFYYVAVRFLNINEEDREAIDEFAETLAGDRETRFLIDHAKVIVQTR